MLYMDADENFPIHAPKARFIKIRHRNVNPDGRLCHSIFDRDWTSDTSMMTLLDSIYGLLLQPEPSDPVNTTITLGFHHDEVEFADEVRKHVQRHGLNTRAEWKAQLMGEAPAAEEKQDDRAAELEDEDSDVYDGHDEDEDEEVEDDEYEEPEYGHAAGRNGTG